MPIIKGSLSSAPITSSDSQPTRRVKARVSEDAPALIPSTESSKNSEISKRSKKLQTQVQETRSHIQDEDFSALTEASTKHMKAQTKIALLAQANSSSSSVLRLLS